MLMAAGLLFLSSVSAPVPTTPTAREVRAEVTSEANWREAMASCARRQARTLTSLARAFKTAKTEVARDTVRREMDFAMEFTCPPSIGSAAPWKTVSTGVVTLKDLVEPGPAAPEIKRALRRQLPRLQRCMRRAAQARELTDVVFRVDFDGDGAATRQDVFEGTAATDRCFSAALGLVRWPALGESRTVQFRLHAAREARTPTPDGPKGLLSGVTDDAAAPAGPR